MVMKFYCRYKTFSFQRAIGRNLLDLVIEANVSHMGGTTDVSKKIYSGERAFMDTLKTMSLGNMMEDENETDNLENSLDDQADGICASHVLEQPIDPPEGYVGSSSRTLPFASVCTILLHFFFIFDC